METVLHHQSPARETADVRRSKPTASVLLGGYALLFVSSLTFILTDQSEQPDELAFFLFHYVLAVAYVVILVLNKAFGIRKSWQPSHLPKTIVLLHLFLLSAYGLNRDIPVFEASAQWLCVYMVISSVAILSAHYYDRLHPQVQRITLFICGSAVVYYCYLTLYTLQWFGYGLAGLLAIGIGGHIFVPLFMLTAMILQLKQLNLSLSRKLWVTGGGGLTVLFVTAFCVEWNNRMETIEKVANESVLTSEDDRLPEWVRVGREVSDNWITTRALKEDLIYTTWDRYYGNSSFFRPAISWNEVRQHDPLVFIGSVFAKNPMTREDRIQVLKTSPGLRHSAEERLWSGNGLTTSFVVSDVDIYPGLHLAYTEKYLNVKSTRPATGAPQEAIYTFHLPEGSIVTSLSLWVNGVEEKAMLTAKQKATNAYNAIVGIERRDPSVVHWQEGNTVSVRVFPCTSAEERRFRIGFTSPLPEQHGQLVYRNVPFEGPSADDAKETIRLRFMGEGAPESLPGFEREGRNTYIHSAKYDAGFGFTIPSVALRENRFTFNGYQYTIMKAEPKTAPFNPERIYLDLNSEWSDRDLEGVRPLIRDFDVFVFDGLPQRLTDISWDQVTRRHQRYNYSVFPFHKVSKGSLVITKGTRQSPLVRDFNNSAFARNLTTFFQRGVQICVFDIGDENSNYISTLRELRALRYKRGTIAGLIAHLRSGQFPVFPEGEDRVYLHDADMWITRTPASGNINGDNAPDHTARLFAYNNIMRKVGPHYFGRDVAQDDLIAEASAAYLVSPVSSLIVLETKDDYKRFDIRASKNSLLNAKKEASGAVPEPAEWVLILTFIALVIFTIIRRLL